MSFTITNENDQGLDCLQITDLSTGIQVKIIPSCGAMLQEFSIPLGNRRIQVVNGYKDLADLQQHHALFYKSAKLSPFVCRIAGGKYKFDGAFYEFQDKFKDGSAIHGILSDKPFTVLEKITEPDHASVLLSYVYHQENPAYPFPYSIDIRYTLKHGGRLSLATTVTNLHAGVIPMGDGWHPYFKMGGKTDEWLLSFRSRTNLIFDDWLIPTGAYADRPEFLSPTVIGNRFLDHCYQLTAPDGTPAATLENPETGLLLSFFPDENYPYLQIYTPEDRESIAIENLSAAPDSFNNGMGLRMLEPGTSQSFTVLYQLKFR